MKHSNDYDSVFKTMKLKTKRLFIPVINEIFGRRYNMNEEVIVLSSECSRVNMSVDGFTLEPHLIESDFRIKIRSMTYLIEAQSYDDDTIQLRIMEYAFLSAINEADYGPGWAQIKMPDIAIIYIKCGTKLPKKTKITIDFPGHRVVKCTAKNIFLQKLTKEYIVRNRLYPYIPFYIARYEKDLSRGIIPSGAVDDLEFFKKYLLDDLNKNIIKHSEALTLIGFVNNIIRHITDGNEIEERMVNIMGGVILETLPEQYFREGKTAGIEEGLEQGINKGEELLLIRQVIFNKSKGRNALEMTEFLDASLEKLELICQYIGNNYMISPEEIYEKIHCK